MSTRESRRRQRAVMATDSEWRPVRERVAAAGMDVSRFIVERATAPAPAHDPSERLRDLVSATGRIERLTRVLFEVERQRVEDHAGPGTWEALVGSAQARVEAEETLG